MPEGMERLGRLKASLTGLRLDAQLEPSHALVDRVVSGAEEQSIFCTEVTMLKKEPALEFSADGSIRLSKKQPEASADTAGEWHLLFRLQTLLRLLQLTHSYPSSSRY